MAVERGVKLSRPIERGAEKITYVEITGAIEQAGSCVVCRCLMC